MLKAILSLASTNSVRMNCTSPPAGLTTRYSLSVRSSFSTCPSRTRIKRNCRVENDVDWHLDRKAFIAAVNITSGRENGITVCRYTSGIREEREVICASGVRQGGAPSAFRVPPLLSQ